MMYERYDCALIRHRAVKFEGELAKCTATLGIANYNYALYCTIGQNWFEDDIPRE